VTTVAPDYSDFQDDVQGDDAERHGWLNSLAKAAIDLPRLEGDVERAQSALKKAQEALSDTAERLIPELMEKLDLTVYPLKDGGRIEIKDKFEASIPVPVRPVAYQWLRENGQGALIKREVKMTFGMGEDERAKELVAELRAKGLAPENKEAVHPSTLVSWVKEMYEGGRPLPENLFSVFRRRTATIKGV
jgi:hypothetical protein